MNFWIFFSFQRSKVVCCLLVRDEKKKKPCEWWPLFNIYIDKFCFLFLFIHQLTLTLVCDEWMNEWMYTSDSVLNKSFQHFIDDFLISNYQFILNSTTKKKFHNSHCCSTSSWSCVVQKKIMFFHYSNKNSWPISNLFFFLDHKLYTVIFFHFTFFPIWKCFFFSL